jgi:hypothetical protein
MIVEAKKMSETLSLPVENLGVPFVDGEKRENSSSVFPALTHKSAYCRSVTSVTFPQNPQPY